MKRVTIKMNYIDDIYEFNKKALTVDGEIDLVRGKRNIDGKSIMGLIAIYTNEPFDVIYPADAVEFDEYIQKFVI